MHTPHKIHEPHAADPFARLPGQLSFGNVTLDFVSIKPGDKTRGIVPYFHFRIKGPAGADIGHINFRVGDSEHIRNFAGHVGYKVTPAFRGHHYAFQACRALAPFISTIYQTVLMTCNPDNIPSIRTIERLGATFIDEVNVPETDPGFRGTPQIKRRYQWKPSAE